ncbi:MAG: FtsX-like permease family protein [Candidatus Hydrogenedentes bacterium ADurb.Bin179]|nr:MAG: FtsX-like permease family protein [Candidatus Hydrogenedentes bacterium ADurb.Bin179]
MLGAGGAAVLVMRSLAERRAEYALLAAVGFPGPGLRRSAMIENACLVGAGLLLGSLAATIATLPLLVQSRHTVDYTGLAVLLVAVFVVYIASTLLVVRLSLQTIPLSALRRE